MDKYIVDLLKTTNRIIIPELGAFMTKKDDPGTIVFNEFLKFNDGVFVDHVAEKEAIENDKALEKTESFVKQIFEELGKGRVHVIEGLGEFQKDDKGKIQFIPEAAKKESPKAKKAVKKVAPIIETDPAKEKTTLEAKRKEEEERKKTEEKKKEEEMNKEKEKKEAEAKKKEEEIKTEEEKKKKVAEKEKETDEKKKILEKKKEEEKKKAKLVAQPVVDPVPKKSEETKELIELDEKEEATAPEKEVIEAKEEKPTEKKIEKETAVIHTEKKKSNVLMWLLLSLIPIVLFIAWFVFLRDGKQPVETQQAIQPEAEKTEETVTPQPVIAVADSTETQESQPAEQTEIITEEPEVVEEEVAAQPEVGGGKKFYIVAGCFEKEENADNYVTLLIGKGFNPEKFGTIGRLHAVSFRSFSSREEAIVELKNIRNTTEPSAWLLYY